MKTYAIELQRVKAMANQHGVISARIDALVQAHSTKRAAADDASEMLSVLSMSEDTARVLMLLLKGQLAEFDKRKARSRF
jgi:predicted xylose isomerase-like sugar epimerase